jgi:hypothetical protein
LYLFFVLNEYPSRKKLRKLDLQRIIKEPASSIEKAGSLEISHRFDKPLFPFWVGGFASSGPPDFAFSVSKY